MGECPFLEVLNQAHDSSQHYFWDQIQSCFVVCFGLSAKHPQHVQLLLLVLIWEVVELLAVEASLEEVGHCWFKNSSR